MEVPNPVISYVTANFSNAVTASLNGMGDFVDTIKGEPILLIPFAIAFVGACIALARKLFRFGGRRSR